MCWQMRYKIMKNKTIQVRVSEEEKQELLKISEALDVSSSQIIRESVREKIASLKNTHPRLSEKQPDAVLT